VEKAGIIINSSNNNYHKLIAIHDQLKENKRQRVLEDFLFLVYEVSTHELMIEDFLTRENRSLDVYILLKSKLQTRKVK
jgi:hypothetical protein